MLDQAFDALKSYDWGMDPKVLQPLDEAIVTTRGDAAARKELEAKLVAALKSATTRDAKDVVCRALRAIGTATAVPALAELLADDKLSHMARYALERIPAPEAGQAMLAALAKVSGKVKVGLITSLGVRGGDASILPLEALLADRDAAVAKAAACALGVIGSLAAAKALVTTKPNTTIKAAVADATMACAEKLLAGGNKVAAKASYEKVLADNPSKPVQQAATRGLQACAGR